MSSNMRDDYKVQGATAHLDVQVEKEVVEKLKVMEKHTGLTASEIANTALKRFITHHSDFMPATAGIAQVKKA
jgi:hypothetical protein